MRVPFSWSIFSAARPSGQPVFMGASKGVVALRANSPLPGASIASPPLLATFDLAALYVWHCHIVEHEDNEMMRPYRVGS